MRKRKHVVTHEEVREAMKRFVRQGGMIDKLPDQKSSRSEFIGNEKYETYESFTSLLAN